MLSPPRSSSLSATEVQQDLLWSMAAVVPFSGTYNDKQLHVRWSSALRALFGFTTQQRDVHEDPILNDWVLDDDRMRLQEACAQLSQQGGLLDVRYRVQLPNGAKKQLRAVARVVGESERVPQVVGVLQDCTQTENAERNLQASQDRLQSLGRLTLLGEVASGLAHELNQPLAAITTFAQAGERLLGLPEPRLAKAQEVFKEVSQQALRAGDIIRRMRSLIKRHAAQFEVIEASALIKEFLLMAEPMAQAQHVQLRTRLDVDAQRIFVDATQIQQALMILFQNAIDAVKEVGPERARVSVIASADSQRLLLAVEDQGHGISKEAAEQMFRPFFSTKDNGTGLGLVSARTILEAHGSRVEFVNLPDHGCRFSFVLPLKN